MKVIPGVEKAMETAKRFFHNLDPKGREIVDGRPMAPPIGFVEKPSLFEQVQAALESAELQRKQRERGEETIDDASDFFVPDEPEFFSKHEFTEEDEAALGDLVAESHKAAKRRKTPPKPQEPPPPPDEGGSQEE